MTEASSGKGGNLSRVTERAQTVEASLAPGGLINEIAKTAVVGEAALSPDEAVNVIVPPKSPGDKNRPRYELLDEAKKVIKEAAASRADEVQQLARNLDLLKEQSFDASDLARINPGQAAFIVEGGANRTSVVRRQLAIEAAQAVYGDLIDGQMIYQLGSNRAIPKTKTSGGQEAKNPEYEIAQEIAGDFLPGDDSLTEFGLNLASALQAGYEQVEIDESWYQKAAGAERVVRLEKEDSPHILLIQPKGDKLTDGIDAVHGVIAQENAGLFLAEPYFQPVVVTNGQYRAKSEKRAETWAADRGLNILPPVAIGDEAGYAVEHNGQQIVTAERPPAVYVTEVAILHRMQSR